MPESQIDIETRLETLRVELDAVISEIARIPTVMPTEKHHSNIQYGINLGYKRKRLEREIAELKSRLPKHRWVAAHETTIVVSVISTVIGSVLTFWVTSAWSMKTQDQPTRPQEAQPELKTSTLE